jgi:hypothetical protein
MASNLILNRHKTTMNFFRCMRKVMNTKYHMGVTFLQLDACVKECLTNSMEQRPS